MTYSAVTKREITEPIIPHQSIRSTANRLINSLIHTCILDCCLIFIVRKGKREKGHVREYDNITWFYFIKSSRSLLNCLFVIRDVIRNSISYWWKFVSKCVDLCAVAPDKYRVFSPRA